jgi:hypothetical protein
MPGMAQDGSSTRAVKASGPSLPAHVFILAQVRTGFAKFFPFPGVISFETIKIVTVIDKTFF